MDLELYGDQDLVRTTAARFIQSACPLAAVREGSDIDGYWRTAAELGWCSMLVPQHLGGGNVSGNGVSDAAIIAGERGRMLQPGPFVPVNVVASALVIDGSTEQHEKVLTGLIAGEITATWVVAATSGDWTPGAGVTAAPADRGFVLEGRTGLVQDAAEADWILVTARSGGGLSQFLVPRDHPGITIRSLDGLDLTRRFGEVAFDGASVDETALVGRAGDAGSTVERQLQVAVALTLAETVGAMAADFELALDYAKTRTAFGRPIGSFQAVKHLLADTSLLLETSKAVATAAATAVGRGTDDAGEIVSMAKAFVSDSAIDLAQSCFQVFGGIGHTWEFDQHLYLRRLTTDAVLYGDASWHRERVCRLHEL